MEKNPDFEEHHGRWTARLGARGRDVSMAYLRGAAMDASPLPVLKPGTGQTGIHVRVDGRGVDGVADTGALDNMVTEWTEYLAFEGTQDPRAFTKQFIQRVIGLNKHDEGENKLAVVCGALWLASNNSEAMEALREPGGALLVEFTYDDSERQTRMRMQIIGDAELSALS